MRDMSGIFTKSLCVLFIVAALFVNRADAIDLQPGEIRAPKPGVNILQISYLYGERGSYYVQGHKLPGSPKIVGQQYLLRLGKAFGVFDRPGVVYVQTPVGYVHPEGSLSGLKGDSGVGDTVIAFGVWPYANQETKKYLAVAAYLFVPTGSYDHHRTLNMGENRYRVALQTGFHAPLFGKLEWMGALDAVWYADNPDLGPKRDNLKQKPLYSGQLGFLYGFTPVFSAAATYFYSKGGETSVNGVDRNNETDVHRYLLTGMARFSFGRVTLQYGGDIKTRNGFFEKHRVILRYTKIF